MSEEFLGTRVRVLLKDEQIVEGRVEAISERENLLLLSSAGMHGWHERLFIFHL